MSINSSFSAGRVIPINYAGPLLSERRTGTERAVLALVLLGMLAAFVMFFTYERALKEQLRPDQLYNGNIVKPQIYYLAHGCQLLLMLAAGALSLAFTNFRAIERGYVLSMILLFGATALMTIRGYSLSDFLSTRLFDASGPIPFLLTIVVFIGARPSNWKFLEPLLVVMATIFSVLALVGIAGLRTFTRQEAVASFAGDLNALYWPAAWIALRDHPRQGAAARLRFLPMLVYGLGSLFVQTRLNFVMIFGLIAVHAYLQHRRHRRQSGGWLLAGTAVVWIVLFISIFVRDTRTFTRISDAADAFSARLDEDTRTGQLVSFFDDVAPQELLLGRGSFAVWNWAGVAWNGGTDVGYLSLLLYGGAPLLLTYIAAGILPGFSVLRRRASELQLVGAGIVLLWSLRMFSSSYPSLTIDAYPLLFCIGACISRAPSYPPRHL